MSQFKKADDADFTKTGIWVFTTSVNCSDLKIEQVNLSLLLLDKLDFDPSVATAPLGGFV